MDSSFFQSYSTKSCVAIISQSGMHARFPAWTKVLCMRVIAFELCLFFFLALALKSYFEEMLIVKFHI